MAVALQKYPSGIVDPDIPSSLHTEAGFRPAWLLSPYKDHNWTVSNIGDSPSKVIVFNVTMPGGGKLADHPNLYDSIKRIAFGVRTGPLAFVENAEVHAVIVNNLTTLACWMLNHDIERLDQLSQSDAQEYALAAVYGVDNILNTESLLQSHIDQMTEKACFEPGDNEKVRRKKAIDNFPCLQKPTDSSKKWHYPYALNRTQFLHDAGLDQVGTSGPRSVLSSMLDETEAMCGFYQPGYMLNRLKKSRDDHDDKPVSEEHLRRFLMSFQYAWEHRRYLNDAIQTNPFPYTSPRAEARKLGSEVGRTGTIPVEQATRLIERSVRWILDYAPTILDLKDWVDDAYATRPETVEVEYSQKLMDYQNWPTGPCNPFPIQTKYATNSEYWNDLTFAEAMQGGMSLKSAILALMTASAVVIAAFTARRAAEICGLKVGCTYADKSGQPWMQCFIYKTMRIESQIPIPKLVISAVNVLERLSAHARSITGAPYIFQYNIPGSKKTCGLTSDGFPVFELGRNLRRFGYFVDVPPLADGTRWTFKPHQFRRFFAILYIWVYDKGDWGALQWHLRHFTHEMTRRYVSENEIGQIIAVADKEHTAEILANAAMGKTQIGGIEGVRLREAAQRLHVEMAQQVNVVSERKFKQKILNFIERTGLELKAFAWGYCATHPINNESSCNCTNTIKPNHGQASEITCTTCTFNLLTASVAPFLTKAIRFHLDIAKSPDTPPLLKKASMAIQLKLGSALAEISPQ